MKPTRERRGEETEPADTGKQSDLAEGELDTVEESIRKHEERGDQQGSAPGEGERDAA